MLPAVGFVILALTVGLRGAGQTKLVRVEESRYSMGCVYSIVAYGRDHALLRQSLKDALDEVDRLDRLMSHYKPESELTRINRLAYPGPLKIDSELFDFLDESLRYSRQSGGAFDITVGPLMKAWGFFRGEGRMPTKAEIQAARNKIGYRHVRLDREAETISFDREGIELDLGGIAKGYAVDRAAAVLRKAGVKSALISAGGSTIYALGAPPGASAWPVRIQDPLDSTRTALTVRLKDRALSVSGSAEKYFELEGVRYSHIMDPRTGRPVQGVLSVAVIADSGMAGDALDNVLFVLGPGHGKSAAREVIFFLKRKGVESQRPQRAQRG